MAGSAQLWPGPRMRAFFRSLLAAEPGVDAELADRLSARLVRHVARMLVWDAEPVPAAPPAAAEPGGTTPADAPPAAETSATAPREAQSSPKAGTAVAPPAAGDDFDPFAFSIVVVLKRQGRAALLKRLEGIAEARHLHQMATAQHLGVDKSITSVDALREAILDGAEQRLADRRAAAS